MEITTIIALIWLHYLGDFVLQTNMMATLKSTKYRWLTIHVLIYSLPFLVFGFQYAAVNFLIHWAIDWYTSRVSSAFNRKGNKGAFFKVLGFDQALHLTTLVVTYHLMVTV
jgi:hypothetical protein